MVLSAIAAGLMFSAGISCAQGNPGSGRAPMAADHHQDKSGDLRKGKSHLMVGRPAPDFKLEGVISTEKGKEFKTLSLNDYKGKWLVLFFYPADFTFVCPTEIKGFSDRIDSFKKLDAEIVAASTDSKWSHLAWIKRGDLGNLQYPLLADFTKETSRAFGVLDEEQGVALRALFIIDPHGTIQYQVVHNLDVGRSIEETLRVLEALQNGGLCPLGWKPGQKTLGK